MVANQFMNSSSCFVTNTTSVEGFKICLRSNSLLWSKTSSGPHTPCLHICGQNSAFKPVHQWSVLEYFTNHRSLRQSRHVSAQQATSRALYVCLSTRDEIIHSGTQSPRSFCQEALL